MKNLSWKSYLQTQTRNPRFLWRLVLAILAAGGVVAVGVDFFRDAPQAADVPLQLLPTGDPPESPPPIPDDTSRAKLREAATAHDWWKVWWLIPAVSWDASDLGPMVIAAMTALFWLVFLLQAGHAESPRSARFWLCVAGVFLGAISTWPTLFLGVWQEQMWNLSWDGDEGLLAGIRYFIVGVGLREELSKLVFMLPLLPLLVSRRNELERLVVASSVGLGFAADENINYFGATTSTISVSRYLVANFLHLALTGLAGLWLCRAIRWPKDCGPQFLAYFGLIVVVHGMYDALILVPELAEYGILAMILFILLAYVYFHELRQLRPPRREIISLTANFVVGLALLASITLVYVTSQLGLASAIGALVGTIIAEALMAYVFLREMPGSLVDR